MGLSFLTKVEPLVRMIMMVAIYFSFRRNQAVAANLCTRFMCSPQDELTLLHIEILNPRSN